MAYFLALALVALGSVLGSVPGSVPGLLPDRAVAGNFFRFGFGK
jgi:hypothetical protein